MALRERTCPIKQAFVLGLAHLVRKRLETLLVVVRPDWQMNAFSPLSNFRKLWEEEDHSADHQAHLLSLEKHIGARRIDRDAFVLQESSKTDDVRVPNRPEQEGHLIPIIQLP